MFHVKKQQPKTHVSVQIYIDLPVVPSYFYQGLFIKEAETTFLHQYIVTTFSKSGNTQTLGM